MWKNQWYDQGLCHDPWNEAEIDSDVSAYASWRSNSSNCSSNLHWNAPRYVNLQVNEYETAPYFIQLNQNLTSDCMLISVFLPVFAWCDHKIVQQINSKQAYDHIMQKLVKQLVITQKSTNNPMSSFGLIKEIWNCLIFI